MWPWHHQFELPPGTGKEMSPVPLHISPRIFVQGLRSRVLTFTLKMLKTFENLDAFLFWRDGRQSFWYSIENESEGMSWGTSCLRSPSPHFRWKTTTTGKGAHVVKHHRKCIFTGFVWVVRYFCEAYMGEKKPCFIMLSDADIGPVCSGSGSMMNSQVSEVDQVHTRFDILPLFTST